MKYRTIAHYDEIEHEFKVVAPTLDLHELARGLPAAREQKKSMYWIVPASPATAARIIRRYKRAGLEISDPFKAYWEGRVAAMKESIAALNIDLHRLPEIPNTAVQPKGKWAHQRRAFWFAYPLEAAMLDVTMGGGKTKMAIDLMLNWRAKNVLVITPIAAIEDAWIPHLVDHMTTTYSFSALDSGTLKRRTERARELHSLDTTPHNISLINHEAFWREPFASWASSVKWDLVIADEIHREKGAGTLSSKYLHRLGMHARRRLGLTGTMMPHSPLDVYGQFRFLDRGIFGTNHAQFEERYAEFGGYEGREVIGFRNQRHLQRKISTIAIHIDDSNQELPEYSDIRHSVHLEPRTKRMYQEVDAEFVSFVHSNRGKKVLAANSGVKLLRLHQLACGIAALVDEEGDRPEFRRVSSEKCQAVRDILTDLPKKEPVVIFVRFRPDIEAVLDVCRKAGRSAVEMSGKVNHLQRWKAGKADILVAQIQAVKEGVNLTRSCVGIFYSTGISLGDYLQCRKRLHRPPQSRMVKFIHLLSVGTRDVSTYRALSERRDVIETVLDEINA